MNFRHLTTASIFPTPLGVYDINRSFTKEELLAVEQTLTEQNNNIGNMISKATRVFDQPEFKGLADFCFSATNHFINEVLLYETWQPYFTQSWLNATGPNGYHHTHWHQNSIFSGVLYIQTSDDDKIYFETSEKDLFTPHSVRGWNEFNSLAWGCPAKQGTMLIFPSKLKHRVDTVKSSQRISLAFNIFCKGKFGRVEDSTYLELY